MKLRLQVTAAGQTTTFDHAGPVIHVGRDAECEFALQGAASTGVSRRHARIELAPGGATLEDAGSSNGTLHNGKPIQGPVRLRTGDQIQLGYTGPTLSVVELDLSAPPAPKAAGGSPWLVVLGAGAAVALLVAAGVFWVIHSTQHPAAPTAPEMAQAGPAGQPVQTPPATEPVHAAPVPAETKPVEKPTHPGVGDTSHETPSKPEKKSRPDKSGTTGAEEPTAPVRPAAEDMREEAVGQYEAGGDGPPSVLLARRGEAYPWAPLRSGETVKTARSLLSLPGYRSDVLLKSELVLTLWGNIPQFDGVPPLLLESGVMLNVPEGKTDLDLTLDWGRVRVANHKKQGPARVRLRFLREVWDLTLADGGSEVCVELWAPLLPPAVGSERPLMPLTLGLFTKGSVKLERTGPHHEQFDLPDHSRVAWVAGRGSSLYREQLPGLPAWWAKPPDPENPLVADAMLSLKDWNGSLNGTGELVETIQKAVAKSDDPGFRQQGMYFLGALDGAPYLVNYLEDPRDSRVRRAAAHALRGWLSHGQGRAAELARLLQVKANSPQKAARLFALLHPFPADDLKQRDTYQKLIADLNDDNLAVRELASWHLDDLAPEPARRLAYDPTAAADQRQRVVADWQKEFQKGTVPGRPTP
jgi:hypothetical protein